MVTSELSKGDTAPPGVRDRLVGTAIALLRSRGADGFGMSELLEESAVARRSMYQHFPGGKAELLAVAATEAGRIMGGRLERLLDELAPADALAAWAEYWKRGLIAADYQFGCPLAAATQAAGEYPAAAEAAAEAFTAFIDTLARAFVRAGYDAEEAQTTARFVVSGIEGAIITSRSLRTVAPLDDFVSHARRHLP